MKTTLLSADARKQTFRHETTKGGKTESNEETIDLPEPWTVQWKETGQETIEIDGAKIECRVLERKHQKSDGETRSWRGAVDGKEIEVKSVATIRRPDGAVETNTWTLMKPQETARIGDRSLDASVSLNVFEKRQGDVVAWRHTTKSWICEAIPGGASRTEHTSLEKGVETRTTWVVIDFEIASPKQD